MEKVKTKRVKKTQNVKQYPFWLWRGGGDGISHIKKLSGKVEWVESL